MSAESLMRARMAGKVPASVTVYVGKRPRFFDADYEADPAKVLIEPETRPDCRLFVGLPNVQVIAIGEPDNLSDVVDGIAALKPAALSLACSVLGQFFCVSAFQGGKHERAMRRMWECVNA